MTLRSDIQSPAYWAGQVHVDFCETLEIAEEFTLSPLPSVCFLFPKRFEW